MFQKDTITLQNQITAKLAKIETVENLEREHVHKENTYGAYLKNSNNMLNFCDNMGKKFEKIITIIKIRQKELRKSGSC